MTTKFPMIATTPSSVNNITMQFEDFDTDTTSQVIRLTSWFLQFITYVPLAYVLVKRSPIEMGSYKWYILINCSHAILLRIFDMLCQPFRLEQTAISLSHGVCKYLHTSKVSTLTLLYVDYLLWSGFTYTTSMMFLFRYVQTADKFVKHFSDMRFYFFGYFVFQFATFVSQWLIYDVYVWTNVTNEITTNPTVYNQSPAISFVIGFNATTGGAAKASIFVNIFNGFIPTSITILSVVGSYWILRDVKQRNINILPAVRQLYMKLLIILCLDMFIFIAFALGPLLAIVYIKMNDVLLSVVSLIPEFYPLLVNVVLFIYIRPYREFILTPIRLCVKDNVVSQSINTLNNGSTLL